MAFAKECDRGRELHASFGTSLARTKPFEAAGVASLRQIISGPIKIAFITVAGRENFLHEGSYFVRIKVVRNVDDSFLYELV